METIEVKVEQLCQCCECGWIGKHSDSVDKTPVIEDMWLLVCPVCAGKEFFLITPSSSNKVQL